MFSASSAYLNVLCVKRQLKRRGHRDTPRTAEKIFKLSHYPATPSDPVPVHPFAFCVMLLPELSVQIRPQFCRTVKTEITQEHFARFLEWLSPDSERAGEEYERLRFRLHRFFSLRGCNYADELADETINRVILKSSAEEIENKLAYCLGVAKNVYRESLRKVRTHLDIDEVDIAVSVPVQPSFSSDCLDKCLEKLPS